MGQDTRISRPDRRRLSRPLLGLLLLAAGGLALWFVLSRDNAKAVSTEYYEVKRDDFMISIVEGGTLVAVDEIIVRNEVEGQSARIIYIIPEGSYVKKGDLLVKLDSAGAEDQVNEQRIVVEKAQFAVIQAQEQLAIQESQSASDIRAAEIKLELAQIDLKKFTDGEVAQKRRQLELDIQTIEEKLAVDQERLKWTKELWEQGFEQKSKLDTDQLTVSSSLKSLEQATNALWMWQQFEYNKSYVDFKSKVEEAQKELSRVQHQAKSKLSQFQADVTTQQSTLDLQRRKLERDEANLKNTQIDAPADGLVVYPASEGRFSSESMIEEGATIRNRQQLIKLPDTSQMKLTIKVHESHVSKLRIGMPAYIVLDPMPDRRFQGFVSKVGLLPDNQSRWGNPDLKVYNAEILIRDTLPEEVKPGVSARAEVIITNLQQALKIPVQSVTTLQGRPVVYLAGHPPVSVPVDVGLFNTKFIEITSGLNEGDRVLLSPPLDSENIDLGGAVMNEGEAIPTNMPPTAIPPQPIRDSDSGGEGLRGGDQTSAGPGDREDGRGRGGFNREEMVKQFDKNGDGQLDEDERAAMRGMFQGGGQAGPGSGQRGGFDREEMMKRFDKNGDGELDDAERAAMREAFPRTRGGRDGSGGGGGERRREDGDGGGGSGPRAERNTAAGETR